MAGHVCHVMKTPLKTQTPHAHVQELYWTEGQAALAATASSQLESCQKQGDNIGCSNTFCCQHGWRYEGEQGSCPSGKNNEQLGLMPAAKIGKKQAGDLKVTMWKTHQQQKRRVMMLRNGGQKNLTCEEGLLLLQALG